MKQVFVNFGESFGKIKPMHAVNNGPVYKFGAGQRVSNMDAYKAAGIPYARTHDASFDPTYGGEHTVDINAIFPNFDADPFDENSYDFAMTDEYMRVIDFAGTKIFYRLGYKIEHGIKKYNIFPPKDFKKWAIICEHIIKHYNYGWADGFNYNIEYWEIWNEADDPNPDDSRLTWGGTKEQFFELYRTTAVHLKTCFPELKIGGPASVFQDIEWNGEFMRITNAPLDFYSWHIYTTTPEAVIEMANNVRELLDKNGRTETESILNEWNYVKDWEYEDWIESLRTEKNMKGAAFIASTILSSQHSTIDLLMYYDARPCGMNGMFCTDMVCDLLKGYYPFYMFNTLYQLGTSYKVNIKDSNIYACAAKGEGGASIMLAHYNDDDTAQDEEVEINVSDFGFDGGAKLEYYLLDEAHDCELIKKEIFTSNNFTTYINMPRNSCILIKTAN